MDFDRSLGSLHRQTPASLADKLAWLLWEHDKPMAVTMCPEGRVRIERPDRADVCDLLGVFDPSIGVLALTRLLREDLIAARATLKARGRHVVLGKRAAA